MKSNKNSMSYKIALLSYIAPLALQISFFVYQVKNKIITLWNVVATLMLVGIFLNAIRMMINERKEKNQIAQISDPDIVTGGSTVDYSKPQKRSKKTIVIFSLITAVLFGLSALFFNIYNNKSTGLQVVNSVVLSQDGKKTVTTEETDEGITQTEEEFIEVIVSYEFNGAQKTAKISSKTTSKIYVDELKICVDETGKFVNDYGRVLAWKIEAIIFLIAGILLLLSTIFALGIEFIAGTIFSLIGTALFFFVGSPFIENILFNDISCFLACFVNIGIYMLLCGFLNLISSKLKPNKQETPIQSFSIPQNFSEQSYPNQQNFEPEQNEQEQPQKPIELKCKNCGSPMSPTDKFCEYCGTKKD